MYKKKDQTIETQPLKGKKHVSEARFVKKKFRENDQAKTASKFQCPYCKSNFSQKYNLKRHVKQKHEENVESIKKQVDDDKKLENFPLLEDFKCKLCFKVFSTKDIFTVS